MQPAEINPAQKRDAQVTINGDINLVVDGWRPKVQQWRKVLEHDYAISLERDEKSHTLQTPWYWRINHIDTQVTIGSGHAFSFNGAVEKSQMYFQLYQAMPERYHNDDHIGRLRDIIVQHITGNQPLQDVAKVLEFTVLALDCEFSQSVSAIPIRELNVRISGQEQFSDELQGKINALPETFRPYLDRMPMNMVVNSVKFDPQRKSVEANFQIMQAV